MSIYLDSGGTMKCAHVDTAVDSNNAKLSEETWQKLDRNILGEVKTPITDQLLDYLVKKKLSANHGFQIGIATGKPAGIALFDVANSGQDLVVVGRA